MVWKIEKGKKVGEMPRSLNSGTFGVTCSLVSPLSFHFSLERQRLRQYVQSERLEGQTEDTSRFYGRGVCWGSWRVSKSKLGI